MKTRFFAITIIVLLLSVSCGRNKGMFVLQGTVQDGTDSILVVGLDSTSKKERGRNLAVGNRNFTPFRHIENFSKSQGELGREMLKNYNSNLSLT